jgi:Alkaline and neutral invertase
VFEPHPTVVAAWEALRKSIVYFRGQPVGTVAACDTATEEALNYDQVWLFAIHFKKKIITRCISVLEFGQNIKLNNMCM